jgi:hypothetical protein
MKLMNFWISPRGKRLSLRNGCSLVSVGTQKWMEFTKGEKNGRILSVCCSMKKYLAYKILYFISVCGVKDFAFYP